jgi:hypothetical protein
MINWMEDKIQGRVVADAQLHYADWLTKMKNRTRVRE